MKRRTVLGRIGATTAATVALAGTGSAADSRGATGMAHVSVRSGGDRYVIPLDALQDGVDSLDVGTLDCTAECCEDCTCDNCLCGGSASVTAASGPASGSGVATDADGKSHASVRTRSGDRYVIPLDALADGVDSLDVGTLDCSAECCEDCTCDNCLCGGSCDGGGGGGSTC